MAHFKLTACYKDTVLTIRRVIQPLNPEIAPLAKGDRIL